MASVEPEKLNKAKVERLALALRTNSENLFQLILDSDADIIKVLLRNPNLGDEHLLALLKRRDLSEEIPKLIHQHRKANLSHQLILALVKNPSTSGSLNSALLPHLRLFELLDLCFIPGVTPDQRFAAERALIQRLPTTPVGSKISLARRATATVVGELLKEGDSLTVETCLSSPRLKEAAVFQFLNGPQATATTLSMVARHSRWQQRPNLRLAILKNRLAPDIWYITWLPKLPVALINQLLVSHRHSTRQKSLVQAELKRRQNR